MRSVSNSVRDRVAQNYNKFYKDNHQLVDNVLYWPIIELLIFEPIYAQLFDERINERNKITWINEGSEIT